MLKVASVAALVALFSGPSSPTNICPASLSATSPALMSNANAIGQTCTYGNCCGQQGCWTTCRCWR